METMDKFVSDKEWQKENNFDLYMNEIINHMKEEIPFLKKTNGEMSKGEYLQTLFFLNSINRFVNEQIDFYKEVNHEKHRDC